MSVDSEENVSTLPFRVMLPCQSYCLPTSQPPTHKSRNKVYIILHIVSKSNLDQLYRSVQLYLCVLFFLLLFKQFLFSEDTFLLIKLFFFFVVRFLGLGS
jgi:hypothetical protein